MGRQRDPKRDEAFEIYKASKGSINLNVIAAQLGIGDGTVRGWKAKDHWDDLIAGGVKETDNSNEVTEHPQIQQEDQEDNEREELFFNAVQIVVDTQQASVSLLQRRLRIGYTRAARLIDSMEQSKYVGPYRGSQPREVLIKELSPILLMVLEEKADGTERKERNAPIVKAELVLEDEIDEGIPDENGLTPKEALFVKYYLINFNATKAAINSGYSVKSARYIGYEMLTKPHIKIAVKKYTEEIYAEIGINIQRILIEHLKIAFADITDFVDFGREELEIVNKKGNVQTDEFGTPLTYKVNQISFKESIEVDGTIISEVKQGKDGISVKLHDKMKSLDVLAKYTDLLPDKHKRMIDDEKLKLEKDDGKDAGDEEETGGIQEADTGISEESKNLLPGDPEL
jgi:phage terminase small subunit